MTSMTTFCSIYVHFSSSNGTAAYTTVLLCLPFLRMSTISFCLCNILFSCMFQKPLSLLELFSLTDTMGAATGSVGDTVSHVWGRCTESTMKMIYLVSNLCFCSRQSFEIFLLCSVQVTEFNSQKHKLLLQ